MNAKKLAASEAAPLDKLKLARNWLPRYTGMPLSQFGEHVLLLVSDVPITPEGVKTDESDMQVTADWAEAHLSIGIAAMTDLGQKGEQIKHSRY